MSEPKSDLERALEHVAVVPDKEPEIAADDEGATAMAEIKGEADKADDTPEEKPAN